MKKEKYTTPSIYEITIMETTGILAFSQNGSGAELSGILGENMYNTQGTW